MTTATGTAAAQLLEEWLLGGRLASRYDTYVDDEIRTGESFYTRLLAEEGREAAEKSLREWNVRSRKSDFAAGIEPVAHGLLALARIDTKGENTKVVEVSENMLFPRCYGISGPPKMVVVLNQQAPGCGCNQPTGSGVFAPYGRLGLKAITLQADIDRRYGAAAQLGLVLPQRVNDPKSANRDAYTVVTVELNGSTHGYTYSPSFHRDGYLMYAMGLVELDRAVSCLGYSGGHFDDAVGFPGATDYLADALPGLGEYLTVLAETLSADHKH